MHVGHQLTSGERLDQERVDAEFERQDAVELSVTVSDHQDRDGAGDVGAAESHAQLDALGSESLEHDHDQTGPGAFDLGEDALGRIRFADGMVVPVEAGADGVAGAAIDADEQNVRGRSHVSTG
jgi:hypothetical protein